MKNKTLVYVLVALVVILFVGILFINKKPIDQTATSINSDLAYDDGTVDKLTNITRHFLYATNGIASTISEYSFNTGTGALTSIGTIPSAGTNPWAVESKRNASGSSKAVYVINQGNKTLESFNIDLVTGLLSSIGTVPTLNTPAYLSLDFQKKFLLVPFFNSQSLGVYKTLSTNAAQQVQTVTASVGVRPHSITTDPTDTYAFDTNWDDDTISQYLYNKTTGAMTPNAVPLVTLPVDSNPRVLTFKPGTNFAYLINEVADTIIVFSMDPGTGQLTQIQSVPTGGTIGADIKIHPTLNVLYACYRGTDNIFTYNIDPSTGMLTALGLPKTTGDFPQSIAIHAGGKYLVTANRFSDNLTVFKINATTGALTLKSTVPAGDGVDFVTFVKTSSPI